MKSTGSIPMISLLPDYLNYVSPEARLHREAASILRGAGIDFFDPTSCLEKVNPHDRFVTPEGGHYSRTGNEAIAQCLSKNVLKTLSSRRSGSQ